MIFNSAQSNNVSEVSLSGKYALPLTRELGTVHCLYLFHCYPTFSSMKTCKRTCSLTKIGQGASYFLYNSSTFGWKNKQKKTCKIQDADYNLHFNLEKNTRFFLWKTNWWNLFDYFWRKTHSLPSKNRKKRKLVAACRLTSIFKTKWQ